MTLFNQIQLEKLMSTHRCKEKAVVKALSHKINT